MATWQELEELEYEAGSELGDPRRCPRHGEVTSDPHGLYDAPCGACEAEAEGWAELEAAQYEEVVGMRTLSPVESSAFEAQCSAAVRCARKLTTSKQGE